MANPENLKKGIATQFQSGEAAARNGAKGGKATAQKKREKRALREAAELLLSMPVPEGKDERNIKALRGLGIQPEDMTCGMAVLVAQFKKAMNGDTRAAKFLRDTAGWDPAFQLQEAQFLAEWGQRAAQGDEDDSRRIDAARQALRECVDELIEGRNNESQQ